MEIRGNGLCLQESSSALMSPSGPNTWKIDLVYNANEYGLYCPGNTADEPLLTGDRGLKKKRCWILILEEIFSLRVFTGMIFANSYDTYLLQEMTLSFGFTILVLMALNSAWKALMYTGYQLPSLRCLQTLKETHLFSHSTHFSLHLKVNRSLVI